MTTAYREDVSASVTHREGERNRQAEQRTPRQAASESVVINQGQNADVGIVSAPVTQRLHYPSLPVQRPPSLVLVSPTSLLLHASQQGQVNTTRTHSRHTRILT